MAHNFVLLTAAADVNEFIKSAMNARDTDYVPADKKADVLASTKTAGPGETMEVTFKAPGETGQLSVHVHIPGPLRRGDEGHAGRQVGNPTRHERVEPFVPLVNPYERPLQF